MSRIAFEIIQNQKNQLLLNNSRASEVNMNEYRIENITAYSQIYLKNTIKVCKTK